MIRGGINARKAVHALGESLRHRHRELVIHRRGIHALEERKDSRVRNVGVLEAVELLYNKVRVSDDLALSVELLRRREVVRFRVDKVACFHVVDAERDVEGSVCGDCPEVGCQKHENVVGCAC